MTLKEYTKFRFLSEQADKKEWINFKGPATIASDFFGADVNPGDTVAIDITDTIPTETYIELTCIKVDKQYKQLKKKGYVEELKVIYARREKETETTPYKDYRLNRRLYTIPATIPALGDKIYLSFHVPKPDLEITAMSIEQKPPITEGMIANIMTNAEISSIGTDDVPQGWDIIFEMWNTDTSELMFAETFTGQQALAVGESMTFTHSKELLIGGNYLVKLIIDAYGLVGEKTFTVDVTAPIITNAWVDGVTTTSAAVHWTTNEPCLSQIEWSVNENLDPHETQSYGTYRTAHAFTLEGLTPGTTYYFRITAWDEAGNVSTHESFFNTVAAKFDVISHMSSIDDFLLTGWEEHSAEGAGYAVSAGIAPAGFMVMWTQGPSGLMNWRKTFAEGLKEVTFEIRLKIIKGADVNGRFDFRLHLGDKYWYFVFRHIDQITGMVAGAITAPLIKLTTIRLTASTITGKGALYINGVLYVSNVPLGSGATPIDIIQWGSEGYEGDEEVWIDYVAYATTGAFSPEELPSPEPSPEPA